MTETMTVAEFAKRIGANMIEHAIQELPPANLRAVYVLTATSRVEGGPTLQWLYDPQRDRWAPPLPKEVEEWLEKEGGLTGIKGRGLIRAGLEIPEAWT